MSQRELVLAQRHVAGGCLLTHPRGAFTFVLLEVSPFTAFPGYTDLPLAVGLATRGLTYCQGTFWEWGEERSQWHSFLLPLCRSLQGKGLLSQGLLWVAHPSPNSSLISVPLPAPLLPPAQPAQLI